MKYFVNLPDWALRLVTEQSALNTLLLLLDRHLLQGVSHWNGGNWMALRGSRIENFDELWCLGASGGFDFCVSSTSF